MEFSIMKLKLTIVAAFIAMGLVALLATAQPGTDRVIKIDGARISGHVVSVNETTVVVNVQRIARAGVKAIVFAGTTDSVPAEQSGTNRTDLVVTRIGSSSYGHVSQVNRLLVVQNGVEIPRGAVAVIAFNVSNPGNVINVIPSPSPSPRPSPSPATSPTPGSTQNSQDANSGKGDDQGIDLNGLWVTNDREEVQLTQTKNGSESGAVVAVFTANNKLPNGGCKFGDRREKFIDGTLAAKKLTGTMWRCTDSEALFKGCHVASVYKTTFKVDMISKDHISGTRRSEYWGPGGSGECDFTRDPSGDKDVPFRLTRKTARP